MTFGTYTSMVSDDIIPTGGGPATCGCGRVQERFGAPTCDACSGRYDATVRTSATQIEVYDPDVARLPTTDPNQERRAMLKRGQIIRVPRDTTEQRWVRDITVDGEVGGLHNIDGDDAFIIVDTLAAHDDIDDGDYLAVERGRFRLYLLRKEVAEGWDLEVDPAQEDERRTLIALQAELDKAREEIVRLHARIDFEKAFAEVYDEQNREVVSALEDAGQLRAGGDPVGAVRSLHVEVQRLQAERDKARSDLEKTRSTLSAERQKAASAIEAAAIGEAVIDALNGEQVSDFMSSFGPVSTAQNLKLTCDLLQGDVSAQRRVIAVACAVLGVTDDDEADWPKLPAACAAMAADLKEARLTIAAEQGKSEGAPSLRWRWRDDQWERTDPAGCIIAIAERGGRLQVREHDEGLTVWPITEHGTARAAMIFADTKLEER